MTYELYQVETQGEHPCKRTYHASCLVEKFMVVTWGEGKSPLKDIYLLNLDELTWYCPKIDIAPGSKFIPRKFHTVTAIDPEFYNNSLDPNVDPEFASGPQYVHSSPLPLPSFRYKCIIFGGWDTDYTLFNDLVEIDLTPIVTMGLCSKREEAKEMSVDREDFSDDMDVDTCQNQVRTF